MTEVVNRKACDRCHKQKLACLRVGNERCARCIKLDKECKSSPSLRYKKSQEQQQIQQQRRRIEQEEQERNRNRINEYPTISKVQQQQTKTKTNRHHKLEVSSGNQNHHQLNIQDCNSLVRQFRPMDHQSNGRRTPKRRRRTASDMNCVVPETGK